MGQGGNAVTNEGVWARFETAAVAEIKPDHPRAALAPNRPASNESSLWVPGEPGAFGEAADAQIEATVKDCLAEYGLFFPKVSSTAKMDAGKCTADLLVQVLDEGPQGTVSQIEVIGNQENTREEILNFLGLKSGMAITRSQIVEAEQKLWRSARFVRYAITPEPAASGLTKATNVRLSVKVQEYELAPKLTKPLTAEQQALLRLCDWLSDFASRPEDLTIKFALSGTNFPLHLAGALVVSPRQGALVRFDNSTKPDGTDYAVLFAKEAIGLYAPNRGYKLFIPQPALATRAVISWVPSANPQTPYRLTIAGGFETQSDASRKAGGKPPFGLDLTLAPAAFLYLLDATNLLIQAQGQSLALLSSNQVLRMDAATGRLQELSIHDGTNASFEVGFAQGAFEKARREVDAAAAGLSNRYDSCHPFSSLVGFVAVELARLSLLDRVITNLAPLQRERAVAALNKLLGTTVLAPLDEAMNTNKSSESFNIPADETDRALAQNSVSAFLAAFAFRYGNDFFPEVLVALDPCARVCLRACQPSHVRRCRAPAAL